jgi:hypothetical protein
VQLPKHSPVELLLYRELPKRTKMVDLKVDEDFLNVKPDDYRYWTRHWLAGSKIEMLMESDLPVTFLIIKHNQRFERWRKGELTGNNELKYVDSTLCH